MPMAPLRTVPFHRSFTRYFLFLGCDRNLILFCGIVCGAMIFTIQTIASVVLGVGLWLFALFFLRLMAKSDPLMTQVYLRHIKYQKYYPARSTHWKVNRREYR